MLIQIDTREKGNKEVLEYFDRNGIRYIHSKLYTGDYIDAHNPKVIIDLKKDIEEVINNVTYEHKRFVEEIRKANEDMRCKLIILIRQPLQSLESVKTYQVRKYSKYNRNFAGQPVSYMNMETLYKIMATMEKKYDIEWRFTTREDAGKEIINILCEK